MMSKIRANAKTSSGRKKRKGCAVGMDRDKRFVLHLAGKSLRVPRTFFPVVMVAVLIILFVRSGTSEDHIAKKEVIHSYHGSLDGAVLAVLAGTIGSVGEVSAGAFFVPVFVAVEGLSPHDAIPLSIATLLGTVIATAAHEIPRAHPLRPHRTLVDYDAAAALALPVCAGAVLGVYVDKLLPPWMLSLLMTATLLFIAVGLHPCNAFASHQTTWPSARIQPVTPPVLTRRPLLAAQPPQVKTARHGQALTQDPLNAHASLSTALGEPWSLGATQRCTPGGSCAGRGG